MNSADKQPKLTPQEIIELHRQATDTHPEAGPLEALLMLIACAFMALCALACCV